MKALNTGFLWQQIEEVDAICQIFFNESYPKGNLIQHHVLHVVPRFNIPGNFYAAELHVLNCTEAMKLKLTHVAPSFISSLQI